MPGWGRGAHATLWSAAAAAALLAFPPAPGATAATDTFVCISSGTAGETFGEIKSRSDDASDNTPQGPDPAFGIPPLHNATGVPAADNRLDADLGAFGFESDLLFPVASHCTHIDVDGALGTDAANETDAYNAWLSLSGQYWSVSCTTTTLAGGGSLHFSENSSNPGTQLPPDDAAARPSNGLVFGIPNLEVDPWGGPIEGIDIDNYRAIAVEGAGSLIFNATLPDGRQGIATGVLALQPSNAGSRACLASGAADLDIDSMFVLELTG